MNSASCMKGEIGRTAVNNKVAKMVRKNKKEQCTFQHNTETRSLCLGEETSITCSSCCVCSLRHPAYTAHAPYFIVISDCKIFFPHYHINDTILG